MLTFSEADSFTKAKSIKKQFHLGFNSIPNTQKSSVFTASFIIVFGKNSPKKVKCDKNGHNMQGKKMKYRV